MELVLSASSEEWRWSLDPKPAQVFSACKGIG